MYNVHVGLFYYLSGISPSFTYQFYWAGVSCVQSSSVNNVMSKDGYEYYYVIIV